MIITDDRPTIKQLASDALPPPRAASVSLRKIMRRGDKFEVAMTAFVQPGGHAHREETSITVTPAVLFSARKFAEALINQAGLFDADLLSCTAREWGETIRDVLRAAGAGEVAQ